MKNWLVIFLSTTLLFLSCQGKSKNAGEIGARIHLQQETSQYKVPVKVAVVRQGAIQKKITIYGKLLPKQVTALSSQFAGRILDLSLSEGDRVRKEQIVATIRSPKAEALRQATADQPLPAEKLGDEVLPVSIRAPFSGIVIRKFHYSGDVVSAGEPIIQIQDDAVFYLWGQLPAVYLPQVKIGHELKITFPDLPNVSLNAKIEAINSTVDEKTQMAQIRASLPNPHHLLKSDLFAQIDIIVKSYQDILIIPRNALLSQPAGSFVFLKRNGKAHLREVQPGIGDSASFVIRSGLTVGDSIIVLGNYELEDSMAVEVMP